MTIVCSHFFFYFTIYDNELDFGWCLSPDGVVRFFAVSLDDDVDGSFVFWRSWYSWKHGTMHRLVWHSGQWYLVFRLSMRPWASIVFQQKLQPNAGPGRITGQCCERFSREISRNKCYMNKSNGKNFIFKLKFSIRPKLWIQYKPAVMKRNVAALPFALASVVLDRLVRKQQQMLGSDRALILALSLIHWCLLTVVP